MQPTIKKMSNIIAGVKNFLNRTIIVILVGQKYELFYLKQELF